MSFLNGTAQITGASATEQFLVSNIQKPIILTMIGSTHSTANVMTDHTMDSQMATQDSFQSNISQMASNALNTEALNYRTISSPESIISIIDEDTNMSSSFQISTNSQPIQNESQINQTFNLTNGLIFNKTTQNIDNNNDNSIDDKVFKTDNPIVFNSSSCDTSPTTVQSMETMAETVPQYLPLNSFNDISSNNIVVNDSNQMTEIVQIPAISSMSCEPYSQPMSSTVMSSIGTEQSLSIDSSMASVSSVIENKPIAQNSQTDAFKSMIAQNPVLSMSPQNPELSMTSQNPVLSMTTHNPVLSMTTHNPGLSMTTHNPGLSMTTQNPVLSMTASTTTPVTQANNISDLSEMSDAELLCFINPATFDTI